MKLVLAGVLAIALTSPAFAADTFLLPDPTLTPGAVDPTVTLDVICNYVTKRRRHVSPATRAAVLRAYGVKAGEAADMELDHLVPLAIGGTNTAANLWPQLAPDYAIKDRLERELQRRACVAYRALTPADAAAVLAQEQREVADDWVAAYARYVGVP